MAQILLRRDTATNWATANPVLAAGEPGWDLTNDELRVGDGVTVWSSLPVVAPSAGGGGPVALNDLTDVTITAGASGDILRHNGTAWVDAVGTTHFEVAGAAATAQAASQPLDSDLTAIAALSTTTYGRAFLALADATSARSALALGTAATTASTAYEVAGAAATAQAAAIAASQPLDSDLTAIAALTTTSFGRSLLALADATAARTALGLGTAATTAASAYEVAGAASAAQAASQPLDSDLTAIAALSTTSYGRALLEIVDQAALRTAVGTGTAAYVASSTFATAAQGTTADTAVQPARTITAGTGLTGGGTLAADRTLTVAYGTTSTTATVGNDSRVTGAVQSSTATTKGDIFVATGSATLIRQGVGADGTVLTADSVQSDGVKWATPSAPPVSLIQSGRYIRTGDRVSDVTTSTNVLLFVPVWIDTTTTFDRIAINHVAVQAGASSVARLGIYNNAAGNVPGTLVLDAGTVDLTTAVGFKTVTISQSLTRGLYYLAHVAQITSLVPTFNCGTPRIMVPSTTASTLGVAYQSGVTSTLPATATPLTNPPTTIAPPIIFLRAA